MLGLIDEIRGAGGKRLPREALFAMGTLAERVARHAASLRRQLPRQFHRARKAVEAGQARVRHAPRRRGSAAAHTRTQANHRDRRRAEHPDRRGNEDRRRFVDDDQTTQAPLDPGAAYLNRELSWLAFARRVLRSPRTPSFPLLERVKFAGIMRHAARRVLHEAHQRPQAQVRKRAAQLSLDGRTPAEEFAAAASESLRPDGAAPVRGDQRAARRRWRATGVPIRATPS